MTKKDSVEVDFSKIEQRMVAHMFEPPPYAVGFEEIKRIKDAFYKSYALPEELVKGRKPE